jgi:hypothetical protein
MYPRASPWLPSCRATQSAPAARAAATVPSVEPSSITRMHTRPSFAVAARTSAMTSAIVAFSLRQGI